MAAEAGAGKKLMRTLHMVHNDEIWKDHVRHENVSARHKWPETWGYLVYEYRKMNCELAGRPVSSRPTSGTTGKTPARVIDGLKLPVIPKRKPRFPITTSQEIGWRSTQNGQNAMMVSNYGEQRRGKCTIQIRLRWPKNAF